MKRKSNHIDFPLLLSFCAGTSSSSETSRVKQQMENNPTIQEIVTNLKLQLEHAAQVEILQASEQSLTTFLAGPFEEAFTMAAPKESIQKKSSMSNSFSFSPPIKVYYLRLAATVAAIILVLFCSATYLKYSARKPEAKEKMPLPLSPTASNQNEESNLATQDQASTVASQQSTTTITTPEEKEHSAKSNEVGKETALLSASAANGEDHSHLEAMQKESPIPPNITPSAEEVVSSTDSQDRQETPPISTTDVNEKNDPVIDEEVIAGNPPISIPTAFTPNGDGNNDYLAIKINHSVQRILKFEIYDRWGQVNFKAVNFRPKNTKQKWDGTFREKPAPAGVYIAVVVIKMKGGETKSYTEEVSLIR